MRKIERISTEKVFEGKRVNVERVSYNNLHPMEHVIVKPAAAILPITKDGKVVLIKQRRTAIGDKCLYEIPAGIIDETDYNDLKDCDEPDKEAAKKAAIRELEEETGYIAENTGLIGEVYTSPGFTNEKVYIFYADYLSIQKEQKLDEAEDIEIVKVAYSKALEMIKNNDIKDLHTVFALTWYNSFNLSALFFNSQAVKK